MNGFELRPFLITDAQAYMELYNHPSVLPFIPHDMVPQTLDGSMRQINSLFLSGRPYPYWAIVKSDTNTLIGTCGFISEDKYHKRIELAYDLRPNHWGTGIMQNAIRVCIKYAFERLHVERVEAVTLPENVRSVSLLLKLNFTCEGILRKYKFFRNQMRDVKSFSFTKEDYLKYFTNKSNVKN